MRNSYAARVIRSDPVNAVRFDRIIKIYAIPNVEAGGIEMVEVKLPLVSMIRTSR